jgi:hypothetical protein
LTFLQRGRCTIRGVTELAETYTSVSAASTAPAPRSTWLSWAGLRAGGFTALCCLGVSAAVSLASSIGATFMTRDSTLRPLLAVTLAVTVVGSALTYWRHRRRVPLLGTAVSAMWVYAFIYLVGGGHGGGHGDHMTDHMTHHAAAFSRGRLTAVWLGLAVMVGVQVWDLVDTQRQRRGARSA